MKKPEVNLCFGYVPQMFHEKIKKIVSDSLHIGNISGWNEDRISDFIASIIYAKYDIVSTVYVNFVKYADDEFDIRITIDEISFPDDIYNFYTTWGQ